MHVVELAAHLRDARPLLERHLARRVQPAQCCLRRRLACGGALDPLLVLQVTRRIGWLPLSEYLRHGRSRSESGGTSSLVGALHVHKRPHDVS